MFSAVGKKMNIFLLILANVKKIICSWIYKFRPKREHNFGLKKSNESIHDCQLPLSGLEPLKGGNFFWGCYLCFYCYSVFTTHLKNVNWRLVIYCVGLTIGIWGKKKSKSWFSSGLQSNFWKEEEIFFMNACNSSHEAYWWQRQLSLDTGTIIQIH